MMNRTTIAMLDELLREPLDAVRVRERSAYDLATGAHGERIVLFGAGQLGQRTLAGLRRLGRSPLAFCDNDPRLWGSQVDELDVLTPADAARRFGEDAAFVVTVWRAQSSDRFIDRVNQLKGLGCRTVVSVGHLYCKYPDAFLPYFALDLPHKLCEQADSVRAGFHLWSDEASRREYLAQVRFRALLDVGALTPPVMHPQYLPHDLFRLTEDDVFVDCGAFDGDTIAELIRHSQVPKIIAVEPDPRNLERLRTFVTSLPERTASRISIAAAAVASHCGKVRFAADGTIQSCVSDDGCLELPCVTLDELSRDTPPTYIKMDIEGYEPEALSGARNLVSAATPILAVCVYHRQDHLWRLPLLIRSMSDQYRFFLRPHAHEGWDLVCYAVPASRLLPQFEAQPSSISR